MKFFTTVRLSEHMEVTPEGFLLCRDVPIARTGVMYYGPGETPLEPGPDGRVKITRTPEEVFRLETVASTNAKPLTNEHPDSEDGAVHPDNWNDLAVGVVFDARRGSGAEDDVLFADLLFTNEDAITEVRVKGKRELSCGYDAEYVETAPGEGYQRNIIINHVALVESGRCGARCSIGDRNPEGAPDMKWFEKLRKDIQEAFAAKDEKKLQATLDAAKDHVKDDDDDDDKRAHDEGSGIHIHTGGEGGRSKWTDEKLDEEFGKVGKMVTDNHAAVMKALDDLKKAHDDDDDDKEIEGELKEEAPPGTGDDDRKATRDSIFLAENFQGAVSLAEVIAPGIGLPTFDAKAKAKDTYKVICGLRKKALGLGNNDPATNAMIQQANGGRELTADGLKAMTCPATRILFNAVGAMKKAHNDAARTHDASRTNGGDGHHQDGPKKVASISDINRRNAEFYASQK